MSIYLFFYLFIYLCILSFIYSFIHLFICLFIYSYIYLFIHLFFYLFIYFLFIHIVIYSFIFYLFIYLFIYLFFHLFICLFTYSYIYLSQALRIKRICSQNNELDIQCEKLKQQFVKRGYKLEEIQDQINKAVTLKREDTLKLIKHDKNNTNHIPFITTFNLTLPPITEIIHKRWDIQKLKPNLEDIRKPRNANIP